MNASRKWTSSNVSIVMVSIAAIIVAAVFAYSQGHWSPWKQSPEKDNIVVPQVMETAASQPTPTSTQSPMATEASSQLHLERPANLVGVGLEEWEGTTDKVETVEIDLGRDKYFLTEENLYFVAKDWNVYFDKPQLVHVWTVITGQRIPEQLILDGIAQSYADAYWIDHRLGRYYCGERNPVDTGWLTRSDPTTAWAWRRGAKCITYK